MANKTKKGVGDDHSEKTTDEHTEHDYKANEERVKAQFSGENNRLVHSRMGDVTHAPTHILENIQSQITDELNSRDGVKPNPVVTSTLTLLANIQPDTAPIHLSIGYTSEDNQVHHDEVVIKDCPPLVLTELVKKGSRLNMCKDGLHVETAPSGVE